MLAKRVLSIILVGFFFIIISGITTRAAVEADNLLQDVPRLDGINVYFTEAAGEASRFDRTAPGLSHFAGLLSGLGARLFTLEWRTGIPANADLIVIAGPIYDLPADHVARLWLYLSNGGRLLLLSNPSVESRSSIAPALPGKGGLYSLLWADLGLRARDDVVMTEDIAASDTGIAPEATETTELDLAIPAQGRNPITQFTTTQLNASDPIVQNVSGSLAFFTARSLEVDASIQDFHAVPLIFTTDQFYGESSFPAFLKDGTLEFNIGADTPVGALTLAAASSNDQTGARVIVIGDREFASNGSGLQTSPASSAAFVYPDNARFLLNATIWLLQREPVVMEFPTPAPTATVTITPSPTPIPSPTPTASA